VHGDSGKVFTTSETFHSPLGNFFPVTWPKASRRKRSDKRFSWLLFCYGNGKMAWQNEECTKGMGGWSRWAWQVGGGRWAWQVGVKWNGRAAPSTFCLVHFSVACPLQIACRHATRMTTTTLMQNLLWPQNPHKKAPIMHPSSTHQAHSLSTHLKDSQGLGRGSGISD